MKRTLNPVVLLIVFLAGCATMGVASQLLVPPARADSRAQKWEYFCFEPRVSWNWGESMSAELNKAGAEGWEVFSVERRGENMALYCAKRPLF